MNCCKPKPGKSDCCATGNDGENDNAKLLVGIILLLVLLGGFLLMLWR